MNLKEFKQKYGEKAKQLLLTYPSVFHAKGEYIDDFGNKWAKSVLVTPEDQLVFPTIIQTEEVIIKETPIVKVEEQPKEIVQLADKSTAEMEIMKAEIDKLRRLTQDLIEKQQVVAPRQATMIVEEKPLVFGQPNPHSFKPEDFDANEEVFYVQQTHYLIGSYVDIKSGQSVVSPTNDCIVFEVAPGESKRNEEGRVEYFNYCYYKTKNRKIKNFIKNSPEFGFKIHRSLNDCIKFNREDTQIIENVAGYIHSLNDERIYDQAKMYNIDINDKTISELKAELTRIRVLDAKKNRDIEIQIYHSKKNDTSLFR